MGSAAMSSSGGSTSPPGDASDDGSDGDGDDDDDDDDDDGPDGGGDGDDKDGAVNGLTGKRVLVSGGTSGIGAATARRFVEEGARVAVGGHDEADLKRTLAELDDAAGWVVDVADEEQVERFVEDAAEHLGGIDVLINNAGIARKARFLETSTEDWDRTQAVNLRGLFLVARAVGRRMIADGTHGVIVNMASTNALG